ELPEIDTENRRLLDEHKRRQAVEIETGGAAERRTVEAPASRVRATPAARRLAKQHGIDLADVPPAEAGGIVGEADVQAYLDAQ
ncbi:MAG: E3 binding domain-containing protein, partial [Armatimonadetes bacterium]|nr:E3 binding domain-containing protein [Armatimonadota bacterium]